MGKKTIVGITAIDRVPNNFLLDWYSNAQVHKSDLCWVPAKRHSVGHNCVIACSNPIRRRSKRAHYSVDLGELHLCSWVFLQHSQRRNY